MNGYFSRLAPVVAVIAMAYGAVRAYWTWGQRPDFAPHDWDLMIFTGWRGVALCLAVAAIAVLLRTVRGSSAVLVGGWVVVAALLLASPAALLDVIGTLLPGLGIPLTPVSSVSRLLCVALALTLAVLVVRYRRDMRGGCARCGRTGTEEITREVPRWAWWAAYAAVAGCVVRVASQFLIGFDTVMPLRAGVALVLFEVGFLLAGIVLPLALVHRFGRVWPRWVPLLAGRAVPRWLVLGPAIFVGGGVSIYFGFTFGQLIVETATGTGDYDAVGGLMFMWVAVPAYLVWGLGIAAATVACFRATRPACRRCGHPQVELSAI